MSVFLAPGCSLVDLREGREWDRAALLDSVAEQAGRLAGLGLPKGARVVLSLAEPVSCLTALLACWEAGFCAVLVNPGITGDERARVDAACTPALWLDGDQDLTGTVGKAVALDEDAPALILMTSGTTGTPKGVVLSGRVLKARIDSNIRQIGAKALKRSLCPLPLHFGHGLIGNCLTPLAAGGQVMLMPQPSMVEMAGFGALLEARDVTFMSSVPSLWRMVLRLSAPVSRPGMRVHVGSAPLSLELWREIAGWCGSEDVWNMYGMTESANWVAGVPLTRAREGLVGPAWNGDFAVLRDGEIKREAQGEVLLRDAAVMSGLWAAPEATALAFEAGWLRTGDVGEIGEEGLVLLGRLKSEINRGGVKVLAEEIDALLERHPGVAEACAFGIPDPVAGEAVAAAYVAHPSGPDPVALKEWCATQVRSEAVPGLLVAMTSLPRNDRGKLSRDQVRDLALAKG